MKKVLSVFKEKNIIQKIAIAILLVMVFNIVLPTNPVQAGALDETIGSMIAQILCWLGDSVMRVSQKIVLGTDNAFIECDLSTSAWAWAAAIFAAIVVIAVAVIVSVATCGAGALAITSAVIGAVASSAGTAITVGAVVFVAISVSLPDDVNIPLFYLSPEAIFSNKVGLTDVNFFKPMNVVEMHEDGKLIGYFLDEDGDGVRKETKISNTGTNGEFEIVEEGEPLTTKSTASVLREIISSWYYSLRNVALIGLLSVLVYIGIRIILSSAASEKAKYKNMLGDWVSAIVLVFLLQYIMAFATTIIEDISKAIYHSSPAITTVAIHNEKLTDKLEEDDIQDDIREKYGIEIKDYISGEGDNKYFVWPTNFLGQARLNYQYLGTTDQESVTNNIGYAIIYCVLVYFTLYYLIVYIKRAIYIAFLTIIAPLIALTYPIDKLNDGQAQGFNIWLKEYMYNLLIQPFHLILYTVFISSAMTLAVDYPIYTCVILGFMMPAEKLLRKIFNFNKAETAGQLSAAAGGALVGNAIAKIGNMSKNLGSKSKQAAAKLGSGATNSGTTQYGGNTGDVDGFNADDYGEENNELIDDNGEPQAMQENDSVERRMLDADEENGNLDPSEREYYERGLEQPEAPKLSEEEFRQRMIDSGYSEEDAAQLTAEQYGGLDREQQRDEQQQQEQIERQNAMRQQRANEIRDNINNMRPTTIGRGRKFFATAAMVGRRALPLMQSGSTRILGGLAGAAGLVGGAVVGLASGEGVSGMIKNAGIGGAAGYAAGKGIPNAVNGVAQRIGDRVTGIPEGWRDLRQEYTELAYGPEEARRYEQQRNNRREATAYVREKHPEIKGEEQRELIQKLTDTTVDSGTKDYKLAEKAIELEKQGVFDNEAQTRSLLKMANQVKGREAYSDKTKKEIQNMVHKKLMDNFIKEGMPEDQAKQTATKATKDYMKKLYKLL